MNKNFDNSIDHCVPCDQKIQPRYKDSPDAVSSEPR